MTLEAGLAAFRYTVTRGWHRRGGGRRGAAGAGHPRGCSPWPSRPPWPRRWCAGGGCDHGRHPGRARSPGLQPAANSSPAPTRRSWPPRSRQPAGRAPAGQDPQGIAAVTHRAGGGHWPTCARSHPTRPRRSSRAAPGGPPR